jgi:hypothetical protein
MKIDPQVAFGKTVVAIEPGNEWFKLVQVTRGRDGLKVDKVVLKRAEEVESLAGPDFLKAIGIPELAGAPVIACLPRQMVNVRLFDLPSGDLEEIADMVDLQIARQTPYSRDEIVFDYRLFKSEKEGYTQVMLVIVQTGLVRQKYRFLEDAGLQVGLVTVTTDGWMAGLQSKVITVPAMSSGAIAFFDVDSTVGDFAILNQGVPLFSRTIFLGSNQLDGNAGVDKCADDIGRALETFRNETPAISVTSLALAGSGARLPAMAERLKAVLKMDVSITGGIERQADDYLSAFDNKGVSLAGVLGAATSTGLQVNLMPESVQLRKSVMARARQLTGTGILTLALVGLLSLLVVTRIHRQDVYLKELKEMIKGTSVAVDEIDGMSRKTAIVAARMESRMIPAKVLVELYSVTSDSTAFSSLELTDASQLVCRGTAETVADTVKLVNAMESSPLFKNVKSTRTASSKDRTEFEISCELEKRQP